MSAGATPRWREPPRCLDRLALPILAVAVVISGVLLIHLTRGTSFWADDWTWIATRRGNDLAAFLAPYNGHLSLVPIAIYRVMFAIFGLGSYGPYRVLVIMLSLAVAIVLFAYARPRTGGLVAALAAVLMLFLGPGWQDTMWAFQIPWLLVCAAGLAALMALDRRTARSDAWACALTVIGVCSTSLGLAFLVGIAVELALTRRRWRDTWIWWIPLGLYVIWAAVYQPNAIALDEITSIPGSVAQSAAATLSVLTGSSGIGPFDETGNALTYGWPLLAIALAASAWRLRPGHPPARVVSLATIFVVFAASVAVVHVGYADPLASRYLYVYCLVALALAAELASGVRITSGARLALVLVVALVTVSNVGALRSFGAFIRSAGESTNGALTALGLDRSSVAPSTLVRVSFYAYVKLQAGAYFAARRALGTPAYSLAELTAAPAAAQTAADAQLMADSEIGVGAEPGGTGHGNGAGAPPNVLAAADGAVIHTGPCVTLTPLAALPPGASAILDLRSGPGKLSIAAGGSVATLAFRRFAPTFTPLGTVTPHDLAGVRIATDAATQPWYLEISSIAPVRVCGLPS